jgi:hypothetical protein
VALKVGADGHFRIFQNSRKLAVYPSNATFLQEEDSSKHLPASLHWKYCILLFIDKNKIRVRHTQTMSTMSTFSISSPRFTDEADCQEREGLSPAERVEIRNDAFGTAADSSVVETPAERVRAILVDMEEELTRIPAHDKREYEQALEVCPELFGQGAEADRLRFLRCEDFDAKVRIFFTYQMTT